MCFSIHILWLPLLRSFSSLLPFPPPSSPSAFPPCPQVHFTQNRLTRQFTTVALSLTLGDVSLALTLHSLRRLLSWAVTLLHFVGSLPAAPPKAREDAAPASGGVRGSAATASARTFTLVIGEGGRGETGGDCSLASLGLLREGYV